MLDTLRSFALASTLLIAPLGPLVAQDEADADIAETQNATSAPIVQDYEPDPAIWRLQDDDTTLYFFGTIHVLPEGFKWRSERLEQVIGEVDEVVFESRDDEPGSAKEDRDIALMMFRAMGGPPISERLSDKTRGKWFALGRQLDTPFFMLDRMPPVMAMFGVALEMSGMQGSQREFGVETVLEQVFKDAEKPISAIEDPVEVMRSLLSLDEAVAMAALETSLEEWDGESLSEFEDSGREQWEMEHTWAKGREDVASMEEWMEDPFSQAMYEVLLVKRNTEWTEWVIDRMERPGKVLIAVGAGHFEGPDAVQRMLVAKGYEVERLNPPALDPDESSEILEPANNNASE